MPIFEYICMKCGAEFSELIRSDQEKPKCPVCSGEEVEKKISSFASCGESQSGFSNSLASCTPFR